MCVCVRVCVTLCVCVFVVYLCLYVSKQCYGMNASSSEAMTQYLALATEVPLYGCTKIYARYLGSSLYGVETFLAINHDGIQVITQQDARMVAQFNYDEIEQVVLLSIEWKQHILLLSFVSEWNQTNHLNLLKNC